MKLSPKALKAINTPAVRRLLMEALGCTEFTVARYIQRNSETLVKAAALQVIRTATGLSDSEILEDYENITINRLKGYAVPVHIGNIIKAEVEVRQLTYKEFGALINKHEKTVPDIYTRATMSIDLLVTISVALKVDFIKYFYDQEPMKSIRGDEVTELRIRLQKIIVENTHLVRELELTQELADARKENILLIKERIERYKLKPPESLNMGDTDKTII